VTGRAERESEIDMEDAEDGGTQVLEQKLAAPLVTLSTLSATIDAAPGASLDSPPLPRVWASSLETPGLRPELVVDGNPTTRWSSSFSDNQWLIIDLGEPTEIRTLDINWNTAAAKRYTIEGSLDGAAFEAITPADASSVEGTNSVELAEPARARFLRFVLTERNTPWGFSIHEVLINGVSPSAEDLPEPPADAAYRNASLPAERRVDDLLSRMSFREKVRMLSGTDMFFFPGNERLGLGRLRMADASMGLRLPESTAFPSFVSLAATFDPGLAARYGDAVAEECRAKGVHVLLGPGVNLYRVPQGGRNFEYLGEDPYLASAMVVPYIRAVQDRGVMATVKHFAVNNHEWHRKASNSVVDERTLRELYFPAFEAAVREAGVGAVMTSYNLVNGEWAAQHPWLVQGVLRDEWGFDGVVMTDWWSIYDALKTIRSGVSLEMPHPDVINEPVIRDLIAAGLVAEADVDRMLGHTMRGFFRFGFYDREQTEPDVVGFGGPHDDISLKTARKGTVLLRNENGFLPLDRARVERIVLLGKNARETETSGYGAARVEPTDPVSILASVEVAAGAGVRVEQFDTLNEQARAAMERADAVYVSVATREREANDRPFELSEDDRALIACATAASDRVGVLVTAGSGVEMAPWIDRTRAVLMAWFGGNVGNTAVGEILFGDVNPSGRLPFTIERAWADSAAYGRFLPHDAEFNDQPIWGLERAVFPVVYDEGLLSGYRHFDACEAEPMFAFGHGLSYTTFAYDDLEIRPGDSAGGPVAVVRFRVTNTGDRAGDEVAQLYLGREPRPADRPVRVLKGFRRVSLCPGDSETVELEIDRRDLRTFDVHTSRWATDPGRIRLSVGSACNTLPLTGVFEHEGQ